MEVVDLKPSKGHCTTSKKKDSPSKITEDMFDIDQLALAISAKNRLRIFTALHNPFPENPEDELVRESMVWEIIREAAKADKHDITPSLISVYESLRARSKGKIRNIMIKFVSTLDVLNTSLTFLLTRYGTPVVHS